MTARLLVYASAGAGAVVGLGIFWSVWRSCRNSTAKWSDLFVDHATGQASHTKVWANVANAAVLGLTVRVCWNATPEQVVLVFATVLGLIGGSQVASRIISAKYGAATVPGTTVERVESTERRTTVAAAPENAVNPQPRSTS